MTDDLPRRPARDAVEILGRETAYDGFFKLERWHLRHERFDGGWTGEMTRELFERGHAAAVLPYDPERDEVVLIEQFRIGAHAAGLDPWMVEVVAGIIEDGERPEQVVRREALEECGLHLSELVPLHTFLLSPGGSSETLHLYAGRVDTTEAGGHFGVAEEHEDIRAFTLPAEEAIGLMQQGRIHNAPALVALQWLQTNRPDLQRRWRLLGE